MTADGLAIGSHKAIVRESDNSVLGVVGKGYHAVQNAEAFAFLDGLGVSYHTAGSLKEGRHVWMLAQFDRSEIVKGDAVDKFLLLYNTHDGSRAIRALETHVRVVCANTAQMALSEGKGQGISIRHTVHVLDRLEKAKEILAGARERSRVFDAFAKRLAKFRMNDKRWSEYSEELFPQVAEDATKLGRTLRDNQRGKLTELFVGGVGQDIKGVAGTGWAAHNATVEYANYFRGAAKKDGAQERRFESVVFGSGSEFIDRGVMKLNDMLAAA